jgi:hypothetical protein
VPLSLRYTPLEKLKVARPVDRIAYVRGICTGRTVLDLGAMDETAYAAKQGRGTWLHEEIAKVAARVIGLDNSSVIPASGLRTGDRSMIHRGDIHDLQGFLFSQQVSPDVVVAGELIEHVPNPLAFLRSISALPSLRGKTLVLTTPNATALHNCVAGLAMRESTHPDHLCILSYKTLNTLFIRSGFADWEIRPYYARFTEMKERFTGVRKALVGFCESTVNVAEVIWPLLAFGLVGHVEI